jgi:hypothetical protein
VTKKTTLSPFFFLLGNLTKKKNRKRGIKDYDLIFWNNTTSIRERASESLKERIAATTHKHLHMYFNFAFLLLLASFELGMSALFVALLH